MKIVIVDDDEDARIYLEVELTSLGHEVISAVDGQEALSLIRRNMPDLVVSDGLMPRMDGFELCRQIKQDTQLKDIPFIFYTGTYVDSRDKELALTLGAARFLVKPLEPVVLLQVIEEVMGEPDQTDELKSAGEVNEVVVLEQHRDVLARKLDQKQQEFQENEKRQHHLIGVMLEVMKDEYLFYSHGVDGVFTYISPSVRNLLGYEPGEFMLHYSEYLTDDPANQEVEVHTKAAIRGERGPSYELEIYHKDGSRRWLEVTEFPVKDEQEKVVSVEGVAHDITQQKQARIAATEMASRNTLILESAGEGIFGLDRDGNHTFVNPAGAKMLGWSSQELLGGHSHSIWHHSRPDGRPYPEEECPIYKVIRSGVAASGEEYFIRKNGNFFPVEFTGTPIMKGGDVVGAVISFYDISEYRTQERQLKQSLKQTVEVVATALEKRDPYTAGHQRRVAELAKAIGQEMELPEQHIEGLYVGGIIHDIGKISVPTSILTKPGRLSELEYSLIKTHVENGVEIISNIDFPWPVEDMLMQHHERLDGSGYPNGLKAEDIILESRILSVADVVEAISSHRPYRAALGIDAGLEEINNNRGILYDPDVVDLCIRLFKENRFSWA